MTPSYPSPTSSPASVIMAGSGDIFDHICVDLPLSQLTELAVLSTRHRLTTKKTIRHRFHALLKRYHLDPIAFRDQLRTMGSFISGDAALDLVMNTETAYTLDVYCTSPQPHVELREHLSEYGWKPEHPELSMDRAWDAPPGVACQRTYRHDSPDGSDAISNNDGLKIRLLSVQLYRTMLPLACMPTTALMNYVTADHLVVAYPQLTFNKRAIVNHRRHPRHPRTSALPRAVGVEYATHVHRLSDMGFDTSKSFTWPGPCGSACGVHLQHFTSPSACNFVFDDEGKRKSEWYVGHGAGFRGDDVRFFLRGHCNNKECPNWHQDV